MDNLNFKHDPSKKLNPKEAKTFTNLLDEFLEKEKQYKFPSNFMKKEFINAVLNMNEIQINGTMHCITDVQVDDKGNLKSIKIHPMELIPNPSCHWCGTSENIGVVQCCDKCKETVDL
jgi:hypothetical protein